MQDDPGRLIWEDFQNFTTIQIFPFEQIQLEMQLDLGPFASSESDFSQQQQLLQLLQPAAPNVRTQSPSVPKQCPSRVPVSEGKYRHNQSSTIQLSSPSAPNFRGKPARRQFAPNFRLPQGG